MPAPPEGCYLPGCELVGEASPLAPFGTLGNPYGGFGGQVGGGGYPTAFPKRSPRLAPPRATQPRPPLRSFAPSPGFPNPPAAPAPVPPAAPPPTVPPPELPTPELPEDRPGVGERIFFPIPQKPAWARLINFLLGPYSPLGDFGQLLLHTEDLGPDAATEAARVSQLLGFPAAMDTLARAPLATSLPNPYYNPDFQIDPYAEPQPAMQPLIVTAPRPARLPELAPGVAPVPGLFPFSSPGPAPGFATSPLFSTGVLPGISPASRPGDFPGARTSPTPRAEPTTPRVGPTSTPSRFLTPLAPPSALPLTLAAPSPAEVGRPVSTDDCAKSKTKGKKRKARNVCYRGVYYERASGLTKYRRERISCR